MNFLQLEQEYTNRLSPLYEVQEAKSLFLICIQQLFGHNRAYFLLHQQDELPAAQLDQIEEVLSQLKSGKPIQYIFGETEFYGLRFKVNPSVLIPRPETEELVKWMLDTCKEQDLITPKILDIGTGSGCIPISFKKHFPEAQISAMDISESALQTAQENAAINGLAIDFIQQDILTGGLGSAKFDIIVSNPPYITLAEKSQMRDNVLKHEPHTALFVPNEDPMLFYRRIADLAQQHLVPNGMIFFEINEQFGPQIVQLLEQRGFKGIALRKDLPGKDRMVKASLP